MTSSQSALRRPKAFTLIELLTVIAIIGILAAILIPVVGAVRDSARGAKCASNVRQQLQGVLMFAADNDDQLPAAQNRMLHEGGTGPFPTPPQFPQSWNTWHAYIAKYLDVRVQKAGERPWTWVNTYSREPTVFDCPTHIAKGLIGVPNPGDRLAEPYSYGLNAELPDWTMQDADRRSGKNLPLGRIIAPSRTMAIMETSDWSAVYSREIGQRLALIPHGDGQNVGFYDGSVQRYSYKELFEEIQRDDPFWVGGLPSK